MNNIVYKIRFKKLNKFVGSGLSLKGPEKIWTKLGSARNAISQKEINLVDGEKFKRSNYEIVEFELLETGTYHAIGTSGT